MSKAFGVRGGSFQIKKHEDSLFLPRVMIYACDQLPEITGAEFTIHLLQEAEKKTHHHYVAQCCHEISAD